MKGHQGKILKLDLTNRAIVEIPTSDYEDYVGGFGMGIAAFWDTIDKDYLADSANTTGWEEENVVCLFPGPYQGTLSPNPSRTEVMGVAPEAFPRPQFTRGNFGGRWGAMLKFAGWDGVIVTGKADAPVWVDIRDGNVEFKDAAGIWGLTTFAAQEEIWREVNQTPGDWYQPTEGGRDLGRTTWDPAVVTIGPAGENLVHIACLCHDSASANGYGGFGSVFGSKNLKAISVIGTGTVEVADATALLETREWAKQFHYQVDTDEEMNYEGVANMNLGEKPWVVDLGMDGMLGGTLGCFGCDRSCRPNTKHAEMPGGEMMCIEAALYTAEDIAYNGESTMAGYTATRLTDAYGLNAYPLYRSFNYMNSVYKRGLIGPGNVVDTTLDFSTLGSQEFIEEYMRAIAYREPGMGDDLAGGLARAAMKWGIYAEDQRSGALDEPYWMGEIHHGDDMAYSWQSLMTGRDINMHDLCFAACMKSYLPPEITEDMQGITAEEVAAGIARVAGPWYDPLTADNSEENAWSIHVAHRAAYQRRYSNFWKNSTLTCDWDWPSTISKATEDGRGATPEGEQRYFKAITGVDMSWEDGLELGRKFTNFERAIHVMQGRHRDEEYFPPAPPYDSYLYHDDTGRWLQHATYTCYDSATDSWSWQAPRFNTTKEKFDEFKTAYYELEGWDTQTGRPTKATLDEVGLGHVAEELAKRDLI